MVLSIFAWVVEELAFSFLEIVDSLWAKPSWMNAYFEILQKWNDLRGIILSVFRIVSGWLLQRQRAKLIDTVISAWCQDGIEVPCVVCVDGCLRGTLDVFVDCCGHVDLQRLCVGGTVDILKYLEIGN